MPYTFELSFSGLCIFTFAGSDRTQPTEVNVLLVNARGSGHDDHVPRLSYRPRDLDTTILTHTLAPAPDGSQIAIQNLSREQIEIDVPAGTPMTSPPLIAVWRNRTTFPNLDQAPDLRDPGQEEWLDWVMALQRVNSETPDHVDDPPFNGLTPPALVIARVRLARGRLLADRDSFPRTTAVDPMTGKLKYGLWDFRVPPSGPVLATHAMAGRVILRISGVPNASAVVLRGRRLNIPLRAPQLPDNTFESTVRASITNLPSDEDPRLPQVLHHFAHFYDLVNFRTPPRALRLPVRRGAHITSTTVFCPPTTYERAN